MGTKREQTFTVQDYLIAKMGRREFGRLLDRMLSAAKEK